MRLEQGKDKDITAKKGRRRRPVGVRMGVNGTFK